MMKYTTTNNNKMSSSIIINNSQQKHFGYRQSIDYIHRLVTETPYAKKFTLEERNPEWVQFRNSLSKTEKFTKCHQRVIGNAIFRAKDKRMCLYCWMPTHCCNCHSFKDSTTLSSLIAISKTTMTSSTEAVNSRSAPLIDIKPVFILHPDEFLSPTNSGHIAAMSLDAPIVLMGLPGFEGILRDINHLRCEEYTLYLDRALDFQNQSLKMATMNVDSQNVTDNNNNKDDNFDAKYGYPLDGVEDGFLENVVLKQRKELGLTKPKVCILYPEQNGEILEDYIHREVKNNNSNMKKCTEKSNNNTKENTNDENDDDCANTVSEPLLLSTSSPSSQHQHQQQFVVHLLDATWGQAHRLNRHLPRKLDDEKASSAKEEKDHKNDECNIPPRVSLVIDNNEFGNGLFVPLRKRTRETGCSTLEATSIAMNQLISSFIHSSVVEGNKNKSNNDNDDEIKDDDSSKSSIMSQQQQYLENLAKNVSSTLIWNMELFVDLVVTLKHLETRHDHNFRGGEIAVIVEETTKRLNDWFSARRDDAALKRPEPVDIEVLKKSGLLAPPVLRYCTICDKYVGNHRMLEHCRGNDHARVFEKRMKEEMKKMATMMTGKKVNENENDDDDENDEKHTMMRSELIRRVWYPSVESKNNDPTDESWKRFKEDK